MLVSLNFNLNVEKQFKSVKAIPNGGRLMQLDYLVQWTNCML